MSSESTDARSSLSSSRSISSYTESINSADSWRVRKSIRKPPPLLRLTASTVAEGPPSAIASVKPTLETIPASPPFELTAGDKPCGSQHPSTTSFAAFGPPRPPSFEIPSETTLRRAKMERLKRKLGDGVPAKLVFPADDVESLRSNYSVHGRSGSRHSTIATTESLPMTQRYTPSLRFASTTIVRNCGGTRRSRVWLFRFRFEKGEGYGCERTWEASRMKLVLISIIL